MTNNPLERKIIATYLTEDAVNQTKVVLTRKLGLDEEALTIVEPKGISNVQQLTDENLGNDHPNRPLVYPFIGLTLGMIVALVLAEFGPRLTSTNALYTYIACMSSGLFIGVLYASICPLKPEHNSVNLDGVQAQGRNSWTLLIKTQNIDIPQEAIREEIKHTQYQTVN